MAKITEYLENLPYVWISKDHLLFVSEYNVAWSPKIEIEKWSMYIFWRKPKTTPEHQKYTILALYLITTK